MSSPIGHGGGLIVNKKEFSKISVGLKAAYPRFTFLSTDEEMEFWYQMLQDIDYMIVQNAVMEHISTSSFPPSIAEIRKLCAERFTKAIPSFDEAWGTVQRAMSTCGWENPQKAYAMMDNMTAGIVKNLGWNQLCLGENAEANRANFRIAYEEKAKAAQQARQIPGFVEKQKQQLIEQYVPAGPAIDHTQRTQIEAVEEWKGTPPPESVKRRMNELFGGRYEKGE